MWRVFRALKEEHQCLILFAGILLISIFFGWYKGELVFPF